MRTLPMHATGKSAPWPLVAASLALAQTAFVAAAAALVAGADELASGSAGAREPVLAAHLAGAVFFPLAVTGASWHLLPVMLRNSLPKPRRLWLVLGLFCGGVVLAPGVAAWSRPVAWVGAAMLAAGLALAVAEIAGLVRRAPQGKVLVVSRIGVALSAFHAVVAFALGAVVFGLDRPAVLGIPFERLVLIHLVVAVLGWLTLLVLSVGRTLAPMLALAPAPGARRLPFAELGLVAGLWILVVGLATRLDPLAAAGVCVLALALGPFGALLGSVARGHRPRAVEGPLAHFLAGALFLVEAAALGLAGLAGALDERRAAVACGVLLLVGWAGGVVVGHLGKLVSLSAWTSWPPGPRPEQRALYPLPLWQAEALAYAVAIQLVVAGVLAGSTASTRAGAALLAAAAALGLAGVLASVVRARKRKPPVPIGGHDTPAFGPMERS